MFWMRVAAAWVALRVGKQKSLNAAVGTIEFNDQIERKQQAE